MGTAEGGKAMHGELPFWRRRSPDWTFWQGPEAESRALSLEAPEKPGAGGTGFAMDEPSSWMPYSPLPYYF